MAKRRTRPAGEPDDDRDDADSHAEDGVTPPAEIAQPPEGVPQPGRVADAPEVKAPPPEDIRPMEGGPPIRHPDTGEPQPAVDAPGDDALRGRAPAATPEGPDETTLLRAQVEALEKVVANLGGNPAAVSEAATEGLRADAPKSDPKKVRARVSVPGSTLAALDVEFDPPDVSGLGERDREAAIKGAAEREYKRRLGLWALPGVAEVGPPEGE